MLVQQETVLTPAGLKYAEPYGFRFWVRPESIKFRHLYAVAVCHRPDGIEMQAFRVMGYMGDFMFDWKIPDHAMSLVLAIPPSNHSLCTFKDIANRYGSEWVLCNASSKDAALASDDAEYVRSQVFAYRTFRSLTGVYFASNGRGSVKIGKTDRCLLSRLRNLQISNPDELRVVSFIQTPNAAQIEAMVHDKHSAKRIRGEWFAMTDAEAISAATEFGGSAFSGNLG